MAESDRRSPGETEEGTATSAPTSAPSATSTNTSTTAASTSNPSPVPSPPNPTVSASTSTDRQTVQVIQQAVPRSQGVAAQYLQQVYAAQQQHLMLHTAALHTHHQHSVAQAPQALQTGGNLTPPSPPSANGNATQAVSVSQTSITLPVSAVTAQPLACLPGNTSTAAGAAVSQHAMLLGNGAPTGSQAQMYLRTQMVILAPAATVTAVRSELPVVSALSSQSVSTQVQSLALRAHLPGAATSAQGLQLKASLSQPLVPPLPKMSISPLKTPSLSQAPTEICRTSYSPAQSHALVRHQLHCPPCQKGAPQPLLLQQSSNSSNSGGAAHRQLQPIALRVTSQETPPPLPSLLTRTAPPTSATIQSQHCSILSVPSSSELPTNQALAQHQQQQAVVMSSSALPNSGSALPDPPPLQLCPAMEPLSQPLGLACPPLPLTLPRLTQAPPASLQRLSLRSVQALAVHADRMLVSGDELPVAEALAQMPFQNPPSPQTVAVDLKVQPAVQTDGPLAAQQAKADGPCAEAQRREAGSVSVVRQEVHSSPQRTRTPTPPSSLAPSAERGCDHRPPQTETCTGESDLPSGSSSTSVIRCPEGPPPSRHTPSPLLPAGVSHTPQVMDSQATLPTRQEMPANGEQAPSDPEHSTDSDMDDMPDADDERASDVLQCEFCGQRGMARSFLRSRRFCSMLCVRRFNVSCTKRFSALKPDKTGRWPPRPRGRPPRRANGTSRSHLLFHRQLSGSYGAESPTQRREGEEPRGEEPPVAMTTRLRLQAEREREQSQRRRDAASTTPGPAPPPSNPSRWSVEQVCSYITSLPGCGGVAEEFRQQEIDGQALLLLTEDHLMSAMNMKLGPALKICAHINSLKEA